MGGPSSPKVFHTTPPRPALKARTTLYSLSVGGAEASQNGFGDLIPANSERRSAMGSPLDSSVIPAKAGIQRRAERRAREENRDPGLRRGDENVFRPRAHPPSARLIDSAATLPSSTAATVKSCPPKMQSP